MSKAPKKQPKVPRIALIARAVAKGTRERGLYSAKLLFEFRFTTVSGAVNKLRLCEERIVLVRAQSASKALTQVQRQARADRMDYKNSDGSTVKFRFVGVLDLLHLGFECQPNEVWYSLSRRLLPMERRHHFLPKRNDLNAIKFDQVIRASNSDR